MNIDKYKKKGEFVLSSGNKSDTYYDLKEAMGEPVNLREMRNEVANRINELPDVIIGVEYGGIPLAVSLSLLIEKPFAILRKKIKPHGTKTRVEGYQEKGKVLLVDDVSTTGNSLKEAKSYLESIGYNVIQMEAYLKR